MKTDRRDAMMLAQTLRAGQLTFWVPDEAHEAMRDLARLRAQAMRDLRKTRQQVPSFLLRLGLSSPYGHWTKMHRRWLGELTFAHPANGTSSIRLSTVSWRPSFVLCVSSPLQLPLSSSSCLNSANDDPGTDVWSRVFLL